jgi:hypothetical protein
VNQIGEANQKSMANLKKKSKLKIDRNKQNQSKSNIDRNKQKSMADQKTKKTKQKSKNHVDGMTI